MYFIELKYFIIMFCHIDHPTINHHMKNIMCTERQQILAIPYLVCIYCYFTSVVDYFAVPTCML